jgi:hypothetical protein
MLESISIIVWVHAITTVIIRCSAHLVAPFVMVFAESKATFITR